MTWFYADSVRGMRRTDAVIAGAFVLAAIAEAVTRYHGTIGLMWFNVAGSVWLAALALRRARPGATIIAVALGGIIGATMTHALWPHATTGAAVWILALLVACYSVGAYGSRGVAMLGVALPLVLITIVDSMSRSGWDRISGIAFVSTFIGLLPTAVGRMVRARTDRLQGLRAQQAQIVELQRVEQESALIAERLRAMEAVRPTLLEGLQVLANAAESSASPRQIETSARDLLERTRREVVAHTEPTGDVAATKVEPVDHLLAIRAAAQPWVVVAAGAIAVGLAAESAGVLHPSVPTWVCFGLSLLVGAPIAWAWRRPLMAIGAAWVAASLYSRLIASLTASLSESGLAVATAFLAAALCRRRAAVVGLGICLLGVLVGVGTSDQVGDGAFVVACWLGGLAVNEASRLVEQSRANNALLEAAGAGRATRALVAERLRIAREIHDIVGHSLTVVTLQSGAARRLESTDPAKARSVMETVANVARDGASHLTSHHDADFARLLDHVRLAGLEVVDDISDAGLLGPRDRALVFNVLQEGLTNVLRHAPGSRARVVVRRKHTSVDVVVANSGPTGRGTGPGTGRGLTGLEDRLRAHAGTLAWAAGANGGFELHATFPAETLAEVAR
ncbi:MAG: sensor histidine kinase [Marmoricola sp.]